MIDFTRIVRASRRGTPVWVCESCAYEGLHTLSDPECAHTEAPRRRILGAFNFEGVRHIAVEDSREGTRAVPIYVGSESVWDPEVWATGVAMSAEDVERFKDS